MADLPDERSVLVIAPTGCDANIICTQLQRSDMRCHASTALSDAIPQLVHGVGALVIAEEAVTACGLADLTSVLAQQPAWSDVPIVFLLAPAAARAYPLHGLEQLLHRHAATVLERPVPGLTLVTTVRAALAARMRQYDVRDLIERERSAREVAEVATRLRDEFVATASHELRSPLNAIVMATDILLHDNSSDNDRKHAVAAIGSSAKAQQKLVEDLLDMSRLLAGTMRIAPVPSAMGALIDNAIDIVRPAALAKRINLDVRLVAKDDVALADPERMRQILWNLLNNAVKFTPANGYVGLALERSGDELVITVADTGKGIKPDFLPHVFDRFRQADQGPTQRHAGLGLGLSIVKQLCELHGATVEARSEGEGKGAQFVVRMPAPRSLSTPAAVTHHASP